ncbi:MAG: CoA pyrophosphatase [Devosia sp.]|nr:CoA pyrophosphatase [Devosia sp.]
MVSDDQLIAGISGRLLARPETAESRAALEPDWLPDQPFERPPVPAAVLIALVRREVGLTVLYTERSADLRAHSGQVSFPGGKIDPTDGGPGDAALREAWEEVDLQPADARILGYLPHYYTGTNYLITPVVAVVAPSRDFTANPTEVSGMFEVPLSRLVDAASYGTYRVMVRGQVHETWQIDHEGHRIWGITANLTRRFRDLALLEATA